MFGELANICFANRQLDFGWIYPKPSEEHAVMLVGGPKIAEITNAWISHQWDAFGDFRRELQNASSRAAHADERDPASINGSPQTIHGLLLRFAIPNIETNFLSHANNGGSFWRAHKQRCFKISCRLAEGYVARRKYGSHCEESV